MTSIRYRRLAALTALFLGATAIVSPARADDPPALVGRVSYAEGAVSFHAPDQAQWSYAAINYPVTSGVSFWDDADGRNEIEIGASVVRMDHSTEVNVLQLTQAVTQLELDQGSINYRLGALAPGETVEIETPHGAVSLMQPGTYRIDAGDQANPTVVVSLEGDARFIGPQSYLDIAAGEQATAIGNPASYTMKEAEPDELDNWSLQRDERERERQAVRYVSPQMTGYQDLDAYGTWRTVPDYGAVWTPSSIPADWVPYRDGHWAWVAPWGWTWIDNEPWGFAPFHYGRWARVENRWVWVPGAVVAQPVYAPALVAFTAPPPRPGVEPGIGLGALAAAIGWIPLGPNEPYYPPYHPSLGYVRGINNGVVDRTVLQHITNNSLDANRTVDSFANRQAATLVPQHTFAGGQAVQGAVQPIPANFNTMRVSHNLSTIKPTPAALMAAAAVPASETTPQAARGPSPAQQRQEQRAIKAETPASLSTAGKVAPVVPEAAAPHPEAVERPVAPAVNAPAAPARPEQAEEAAHRPAAENPAAAAHPEVRQASVPQTPATAPGPAIQAHHAPVELRQKTLETSLQAQAEKPAAAPAAHREPPPHEAPAAVPKAAPVAFHPAEVQKPVQSAPLHALPQGWARGEAKPPAPAAEKKDEHPEAPH